MKQNNLPEKNEKLVSICIPVFNGEKFLSDSLESVIYQSYPFIEIIIVDDCSTDSSLAIAEKYSNRDERIRVIRNTRTLGLVQNWNNCISHASGKWLKLHFQDDLMQPECISEMMEFASQYDVTLILSDREYFYEEGVSASKKAILEERLKRLDAYVDQTRLVSVAEIADIFTNDFLGLNFLGEPIIGLFKKELVAKYGVYDTNLAQISDFEYWLRISLNEDTGFIKKPLSKFRVHGASESSRNSSDNHKVSPWMLDRIRLGLKILQNQYYKKYRDYLKRRNYPIEKLVTSKFTKYVVSTGYFKSRRIFGPEVLSYFNHRPWNLIMAIYHDIVR